MEEYLAAEGPDYATFGYKSAAVPHEEAADARTQPRYGETY